MRVPGCRDWAAVRRIPCVVRPTSAAQDVFCLVWWSWPRRPATDPGLELACRASAADFLVNETPLLGFRRLHWLRESGHRRTDSERLSCYSRPSGPVKPLSWPLDWAVQGRVFDGIRTLLVILH